MACDLGTVHVTKESDAFERQIQRLHELIESCGAEVTWNDRIPDPDNPSQQRQIDVTIKRDGALSLVECRLHKNRQDVQWVEELFGRKSSLRATSVIGVSSSGFTHGAVKKAAHLGVFLRDLKELTPAEIESWGVTIAMTAYYYQYGDLELSLYFRADSISRLGLSTLTEELRTYAGRQSLFNASAEQLDNLNLLATDIRRKQIAKFRIKLQLEDFRLCGEPVVEVEFAGAAQLIAKEVNLPAVLAYGEPEREAATRGVVVQQSTSGESGFIVEESNRVTTVLDLSQLEMPPNCQYRYVRTIVNKEMDMDRFELIGVERLYVSGGPMIVQIAEIVA